MKIYIPTKTLEITEEINKALSSISLSESISIFSIYKHRKTDECYLGVDDHLEFKIHETKKMSDLIAAYEKLVRLGVFGESVVEWLKLFVQVRNVATIRDLIPIELLKLSKTKSEIFNDGYIFRSRDTSKIIVESSLKIETIRSK